MFFKKSSTGAIIICDIGSASLGVGIFESVEGTPRVLFTARVPIILPESVDAKDLENRTLSALDEALALVEKSQKEGGLHNTSGKYIKSAHIFFDSFWCVSRINDVVLKKDKIFLVDKRSLEQIFENEEDKFKKEVVSSSTEKNFGNMQIIERRVLKAKLNGYDVLNPVGKKTQEIKFSLLMSAVPKRIFDSSVEKISSKFHVRDVFGGSAIVSMVQALRKVAPHEQNYTLVRISGITTECVVVSDAVVSQMFSADSGEDTFLEKASEALTLPKEIVSSKLNLLKDNQIPFEESTKLSDFAKSSLATWAELISRKIDSSTMNISISRIFLSVSENTTQLFKDSLSRVSPFTSSKVFSVRNMLNDSSVTYDKHASRDSLISLEAIDVALKDL